jgi:hypothetical protein
MTPLACPFDGCTRWVGHPGRCADAALVPSARPDTDRPERDRCWSRADGTCGRVDHPTVRSACNQENRP